MKPVVTQIAMVASKYRSAVVIETPTGMIDGKSVMGIFTSFVDNQPTAIHIQGDDAEEARADLQRLMQELKIEVEFK